MFVLLVFDFLFTDIVSSEIVYKLDLILHLQISLTITQANPWPYTIYTINILNIGVKFYSLYVSALS